MIYGIDLEDGLVMNKVNLQIYNNNITLKQNKTKSFQETKEI